MIKRIKTFLFTNTSDKQTIVKNTIWLAAGEIGTRLLKLGLFVYAARMLGVTEWGVFSYGLAIMGVFSIFSDIGINSLLLREVAKKNSDLKQYIATSFFLKCVLSIVSTLLILMLLFFVKNEATKAILPLVAILIFIDNMREFGFTLNRAREKMELEAIIKIVSTALLFGIALFIILKTPTAVSLLRAYIIAGIVGLIFITTSIRPFISSILARHNFTLIKKIFAEAWPVGMVSIFGIVLYSIDTIVLGLFRNATEVGYYSTAQKVVQILWLAPTLLATALLPIFSRTAKENSTTFTTILGKAVTISFLLITPLTIICIIFSKTIFSVLFGIKYLPAVPLFMITAISAIAIIPSLFISNAFLAQGKQKITLLFILVGAVVNITLSFILIPFYGMYGAAIAYTLAQVISNIFIIYKSRAFPYTRFKILLPTKENLNFFKNS